jgi:hypothetical protein
MANYLVGDAVVSPWMHIVLNVGLGVIGSAIGVQSRGLGRTATRFANRAPV